MCRGSPVAVSVCYIWTFLLIISNLRHDWKTFNNFNFIFWQFLLSRYHFRLAPSVSARPGLCETPLYSAVQCSTVQYSAVQVLICVNREGRGRDRGEREGRAWRWSTYHCQTELCRGVSRIYKLRRTICILNHLCCLHPQMFSWFILSLHSSSHDCKLAR